MTKEEHAVVMLIERTNQLLETMQIELIAQRLERDRGRRMYPDVQIEVPRPVMRSLLDAVYNGRFARDAVEIRRMSRGQMEELSMHGGRVRVWAEPHRPQLRWEE